MTVEARARTASTSGNRDRSPTATVTTDVVGSASTTGVKLAFDPTLMHSSRRRLQKFESHLCKNDARVNTPTNRWAFTVTTLATRICSRSYTTRDGTRQVPTD